MAAFFVHTQGGTHHHHTTEAYVRGGVMHPDVTVMENLIERGLVGIFSLADLRLDTFQAMDKDSEELLFDIVDEMVVKKGFYRTGKMEG